MDSLIDTLPSYITESSHLTGKHLTVLSQVNQHLPIDPFFKDQRLDALLQYMQGESLKDKIHEYAKELIDSGKIYEAMQVLLSGQSAIKRYLMANEE